MRYHKEVYFPIDQQKDLKTFTDRINQLNYIPTSHCLDNLKHRVIDIEGILNFIKYTELDISQIFEYYTQGNQIEKVCFRIPYQGNDIILILSNFKQIITIYLNDKDDIHITLNKQLYQSIGV